MQFALATFVGLSAFARALPQGVTAQLSPAGTPICAPSYPGGFQISVVNASSVAMVKRTNQPGNALILYLNNGILKDQNGRTGYIASNRQFQFDDPPQTGAIWTAGFSVCSNSTLALSSSVFYECYTGGFYNLYDRPAESNCTAIYFDTLPASPDGSLEPITLTSSLAPLPSVSAATQITDGQPQAPTSASIAPVTQITDGQAQAPTGVTMAPVTQITDGQVQAPTLSTIAPVTQITDGQVQAPTGVTIAPPVSQITDGQIQAPTATSIAPVTQISDGQVQAPTNATVPPPFTGGAPSTGGSYYAVAAGAVFLGAALL